MQENKAMANTFAIASQVFGYLKRTISNLSDPDPLKTEGALVECVGVSNADLPLQLEIAQREEKQKLRSPIRATKRRKIEDGFTDLSIVGSGNAIGFTLGSQTSSENECLILDHANRSIETSDVCLNSIFNQLLWTLKYLKYNLFRKNAEMLKLIETLCEGLGKIVVLSQLNLTDKDLIRFLKIGNTLFGLIRTYEEENSIKTTVQINRKVENVFEQFLDNFTQGGLNAEGQIKNFAFICTLLQQVRDGYMITTLANKFIFRLYVTSTTLWKACVARPHGIVKLVDQDDINSFIYYCHLLEVVMAASPSDCQLQIQENVFRSLTALEEDSGSLFALLPNLALTVYSTIFATGIPLKSIAAVSPLKEINL